MLPINIFRDRVLKLKAKMMEQNIKATIIFNGTSMLYFTNFSRGMALLIPGEHDPVLLVPKLEYEEAESTVKMARIVPVERRAQLAELILKELKKLGIVSGKIGLDKDWISASLYDGVKEKLEGYEIEDSSKIVSELRSVKSREEVELIVKALRIAEHGIKAAVEAIRDGVSELEVAAEAEYAMRKKGAEWFSFETIVASGVRSAYPHGFSSSKIIRNGELVVIDLGAKYAGYCSDITRTIFVGGKPPSEVSKIFETVVEAMNEALKIARGGVKAKEVDLAAREVISRANYGEHFPHSLGHGVGLSVHEAPRLSRESEDILKPGNVVTIEPGIYIPNLGGVRIEDMILVEEDGCRILNELPRLLNEF